MICNACLRERERVQGTKSRGDEERVAKDDLLFSQEWPLNRALGHEYL